jgi:serine/threonine-protein kinase
MLWMLHAGVLLALCLLTNAFQLAGVTSRMPYLGIWTLGLGVWAGIFWRLRKRSGPVTFVERQIAHLWAGSMVASTLLYAIEWYLGQQVLGLSPILGLTTGMVFLVKASILTGAFYVQAMALFATGVLMAVISRYAGAHVGVPDLSISLFGLVSAVCFFLPGLKYYRQKVENDR